MLKIEFQSQSKFQYFFRGARHRTSRGSRVRRFQHLPRLSLKFGYGTVSFRFLFNKGSILSWTYGDLVFQNFYVYFGTVIGLFLDGGLENGLHSIHFARKSGHVSKSTLFNT